MEDVGEANVSANRRILPANNQYRRGSAELLNPMHPGSANMCVAPRREMLERRTYSLMMAYFPWKQRISTWERRTAQSNAPRECQHVCRTRMEDVGEANISHDRRIFPANNEYRRGNAQLLNPMHPGSANMCVEPRWTTLERRILSANRRIFPANNEC